MSRIAVVCGMLVLGVALALGQADPKAPMPPVAVPGAPVKAPPADRIIDVLNKPQLSLPEIPADAALTLAQVLDAMSNKLSNPAGKPPFFLSFDFNGAAFKADGVEDVAEFQFVKEKAFPKILNATLDTYLRKLLERIPASSGATFLVRKDGIEITTIKDARARIWGDHPGPFLPLVNATFEKKTLEDALKELSDQTEHNVVLDARAGDKAKTLVTARFSNLPLDSAVAFLADMAELQPIMQDNAIYVTTRESALRWESRQKKAMPEDPETPRIGRVGAGVRGFVPAPAQGGGM